MIILIKLISFCSFSSLLIVLVKKLKEYNMKYKKMVDFLRVENDSETLNAIGYKEFYGEEYGLRKSYSLSNAIEQLEIKYTQTKKNEYLEYKTYLKKNAFKPIFLFLGLFISLIFLTI